MTAPVFPDYLMAVFVRPDGRVELHDSAGCHLLSRGDVLYFAAMLAAGVDPQLDDFSQVLEQVMQSQHCPGIAGEEVRPN